MLDRILLDDLDEILNARIQKDRTMIDSVDGWEQSELYRAIPYARLYGVSYEKRLRAFLCCNSRTPHAAAPRHTRLYLSDKIFLQTYLQIVCGSVSLFMVFGMPHTNFYTFC